jgi:endonuclease YncB( thermonuclease family)
MIKNLTETPFFSLKGYKTLAVVVKVYDGDTIHAVFEYMGKAFKWKCRISHVDTPEIRTKDPEIKKKAYYVRDKLKELILNKSVELYCGGFDKYGRLLVEIILPETQLRVDDWLIENDYAKSYEGGTKKLF